MPYAKKKPAPVLPAADKLKKAVVKVEPSKEAVETPKMPQRANRSQAKAEKGVEDFYKKHGM